MAGLPDLREEDPTVRVPVLSSFQQLAQNYSFDGVRLDTVMYVSPSFYQTMKREYFPDTFLLGEIFDGNVSHVSRILNDTGIDAPLSFPLAFTLRDVFSDISESALGVGTMWKLHNQLQSYDQNFASSTLSAFGTFLDNHDLPRFLSYPGSNKRRLQGGLCAVFMLPGIPMVYYGLEQGLNGGDDPLNREALW